MSIEQYIRQHRSDFDASMHGSHVWCDLDKALTRYQQGDVLERTLLLDRILLDSAEPGMAVWAGIEQQLNAQDAQTDDLERFIRQNRDAFDPAEPPIDVWENLQKGFYVEPIATSPALKVSWRRQLVRIAAAIMLLVTGATAGVWYAGNLQPQMAGMSLSQVSSEYAELEQHYERDISYKKEQLGQFISLVNAPAQKEEIETDLEKLDKIMNELRLELANVPPGNREQVVRAMIETYKTKTAILERVLDNLQQQYNNNNTDSNNEKEHI